MRVTILAVIMAVSKVAAVAQSVSPQYLVDHCGKPTSIIKQPTLSQSNAVTIYQYIYQYPSYKVSWDIYRDRDSGEEKIGNVTALLPLRGSAGIMRLLTFADGVTFMACLAPSATPELSKPANPRVADTMSLVNMTPQSLTDHCGKPTATSPTNPNFTGHANYTSDVDYIYSYPQTKRFAAYDVHLEVYGSGGGDQHIGTVSLWPNGQSGYRETIFDINQLRQYMSCLANGPDPHKP